jgi:hypothetical protein
VYALISITELVAAVVGVLIASFGIAISGLFIAATIAEIIRF